MQKRRINIQQIGGTAAFINVAVTIATLIVAFGFIGVAALSDPNKLMELAIRNPAPLIVQDVLKLVSSGIAVVLILALNNRLRDGFPKLMRIAIWFGLISVLCLLINAMLSLLMVAQAVDVFREQTWANNLVYVMFQQQRTTVFVLQGFLNGLVNALGMAVIAINGVWYLLVSWAALKTNSLPRWVSYLGMTMGGLSLLPPLGILVLFLGIPWSFGLGGALLKNDLLEKSHV